MTTTDTTTEPTNALKHTRTLFSNGNKTRTVIKCQLADDCRNGHEHFSLTAVIWENRGNNHWVDVGGGCCHEHILALAPEFSPFAALHLSDQDGVPMHAFANAWYWFQGAFPEAADHSHNLGPCHGGTGSDAKSPPECHRIFCEHLRITDTEAGQIAALAPRTETELQIILEDMGLPARWKAEAGAAIAKLEQWTGRKFKSAATRKTWEPVKPELRKLATQRRASGYYSPEQVAARDAAAAEARKAKRLTEIQSEFERDNEKARRELAVKLYVAERFERLNCIYYTHTNELSFNWIRSEKLVTRDEFNAFVAGADLSKLPQGIKFEFKDKPKY